ncbi:MAG: MBL fold metallo-hydrolase [Phycisphaerae bacterium]|nr:MBL fold metallo-hydrolase [Phycisphaerae bacterium]
MKIRPYRLSQVEYDGFSIAGYSVAGEETVIVAPEFDCVFDIGKCPREALTVNHVLLTHGHADHVAGIPYYFAQRDFQGMSNGMAIVPANLVEPLEGLMRAWGRVEGHVPPCRFIGLRDGEDYEIRRDLIVRAFASRHIPGSLGYSIIEVRRKLKPEFLELTGPQIVELKEKGVEITNRIEIPHIAYLGDTGKADYSSLPHVAEAKVLLVECTFFDDEHASRAKDGRHIHVRDLPELLEGMRNEHIVIVHVTRRTNMSAARKLLRKSLPKAVAKRVTFLMSRKYIEDD